jgi:pimeloyl-ACP methyl ester carboxylesterase
MPYSDNQGVRIHYQVEGEGPPLVLQHGSTSSLKIIHHSNSITRPQTPDDT